MAQKFTVPIVVRNLSASSSDALAVSVDGDTHDRIKFEAGGRIVWGTGASAGDVNLYRPSADLLKTDDAFQAAGVITLTSDGEPTAALPDGALAVDTTNETLYVRANNAWVVASGGGGASVTVSDTAPLDPEQGDLWFESDTGDIYVYYSSTWVDIGGSSVANIAVTTTPPSSPVNGDLWFDTDTAKTYVYYNDGTSGQWVEIGAASAAASGTDGAVQFSTGGSFDSSANLVWDDANNELEVTGNVTVTGTLTVGGTSLASRISTLESANSNIVSGRTYYFTNNSQYAPEYGSPYYRTNLYTVSAPAGKTLKSVNLTVEASSPSAPAWVTMYSFSGSQYTYYVWSLGASAGYVHYILDCR